MLLLVKEVDMDIPLNVRTSEKLCLLSVTTNTTGYIFTKMKTPMNVITDHPNKMHDWQCSYFYVKLGWKAIYEPPIGLRVLWAPKVGKSSQSSLSFKFFD